MTLKTPIETPVVEAPATETPEAEQVLQVFTQDDLDAKLAERDLEWQGKLSAKDSEITEVKNKHERASVKQALADAARAGDGFNPDLISDLLATHTTVVNGEPIIEIDNFQLSPSEAISWMRSQPEKYGTLFRSNAISGLGLNSTAGGARGGKPINLKNLSPQAYRELKKSNPAAIYGSGQ